MRKLRWWHRWLGLVVVPFFTVACVTGAILVYQKAIILNLVSTSASLPKYYTINNVASEFQKLSLHPNFRTDALIKAPNLEEPYWTLRHANGVKELYSIQDLQQYEARSWLLPVLEFIRHLHIELLTGLTGEVVLLVTALLILFLSVSGIFLWWPGRKIFHWQWVFPPPSRWQLKWFLRFHNHSGIVLVPMLTLVILTSGVMMWQKVKNALTVSAAPSAVVNHSQVEFDSVQVSEAILLTHKEVQDSWPTYIRITNGDTPTVKIRVRLNGEWHPNGRTNVFVNLESQAITKLQHVRDATTLRSILNQMYPLHSGYGMPKIYTLLVFMVGVGGLWLTLTGTVSLIRRLKNSARR